MAEVTKRYPNLALSLSELKEAFSRKSLNSVIELITTNSNLALSITINVGMVRLSY